MYINSISSAANAASSPVANSGAETDFASLLGSKVNSSATNLDSIFAAAAKKYNVPVNLLKAVGKAESDFDPNSTSRCGAMGIMQLMPGTAKSLGVTDAYDPEQNIMGGANYLSQMLANFNGDTKLALAAYNAGPASVQKYNGVPPFEETQNYVVKVMEYCGSDISAGTISGTAAASSGSVKTTAAQNIQTAATGASDTESLAAKLLMEIYEMQMRLNKGFGESNGNLWGCYGFASIIANGFTNTKDTTQATTAASVDVTAPATNGR